MTTVYLLKFCNRSEFCCTSHCGHPCAFRPLPSCAVRLSAITCHFIVCSLSLSGGYDRTTIEPPSDRRFKQFKTHLPLNHSIARYRQYKLCTEFLPMVLAQFSFFVCVIICCRLSSDNYRKLIRSQLPIVPGPSIAAACLRANL